VRVQQNETGRYSLLKGFDPSKDQSYVLYTMTQERLAHLLFPIGGYAKADIRRIAEEKKLPVFNRPDSQDLCFLGNGDYRAFLQRRAPQVVQPGPIVNTQGQVLGEHQGLAFYTIGQRKGLGIAAPEPLYVLRLDTARNRLIVGLVEELGQSELLAGQVTYISGQPPTALMSITAKIRYKAKEMAAILTPLEGGRAHLSFDQPLRDITPGQSVVFYAGEEVLGGGVIAKPQTKSSEVYQTAELLSTLS
jgi:tRNA-specific 2-thiouridylase